MVDSKSVHIKSHCRDFCVICWGVSTIACSSAEKIKEKNGKTRC